MSKYLTGIYLDAGSTATPDGFDFTATTGELLENPDGRKTLAKCHCTLVRDLIAPEVARLLPEQSGALRTEFPRLFAARAEAAATLGISDLALDLDLARAVDDAAFGRALAELLRSTFAPLHRHQLRLRLQTALPESAERSRRISAFLQRMLNTRVALLIECPAGTEPAAEQVRPLLLYSDYWWYDGGFERGLFDRIDQCAGAISTPESVRHIIAAYPEARKEDQNA